MDKNTNAVALGRITNERRAQASRENGRLGGRPISPERFWQKVEMVDDGCWFLRGRTHKHAYHQISGKLAHRLAYEFANGPIPPGLIVRHRCDIPACVNPSHLLLGTHEDNADDRESRGRSNNDYRLNRLCICSADALWLPFKARAAQEGRSLRWLLEELIRRYVERGLD